MISSLSVRISVLALVFSFQVNFLMASEKVLVSAEPVWLYKVSADLSRKPVAKSISDGYYLELSDHQVNLANNSDYTHYIRHIINESGVQNASEVSVTFSPAFQQLVFHRVLLLRDGTVISELKPSQIKVVQEETDASDFQYNGLKRAFILLKDVRKNDRVEVSYSIIGFNPVFTNKYNDNIYFSNSTAVANYFETIIIPQNRKLFFHPYNKAPLPAELQLGSVHVYHWSNPSFKIWESQPGVPSWFDNYPHIAVSEFENWQDVVDWGLQIFNNYQYMLPAELKGKIEKWRLMAKGDKETFATLAIQFVQDQVRYLGLEMGQYTHQPHSPAEVYQHRFGDCKDKALLLASILQNESIPAYVALVNTEKKEKLSEAAPGTNQFNHAIVAIERSSGFIYIDATDTRQRGALVNLFVPAYGYSLVLKKGESKLQHIDPGFLNETSIVERLDVKLIDTSRLFVTTTYAGGKADALRSTFAEMSTSELEDNYVKYYAKKFDGIQQSASIDFMDDSIKNEITVKENYAIPTLWHASDKGEESFDFFAQPVYERIPNPVNVLKDAPVAIPFPLTLHYKMVVDMPNSWTFDFEELHIKNDSYQFDFVPAVVGGHISANYFFKTFKDNISVAELDKYKSDYKKIGEILEFVLYKNDHSSPSSETARSSTDSNINLNWSMVAFAFILVAVLVSLLRKLDTYRNAEVLRSAAKPIGGWLIVLGISLFVNAFVQVVSFAGGNYLSNATWTTLREGGGMKLQLIFTLELIISLISICSAFASIYWFIKRRDLFPKIFIWNVGIILGGNLILAILMNLVKLPGSLAADQRTYALDFVGTIPYAAIWITYVLRSERVKETFVL